MWPHVEINESKQYSIITLTTHLTVKSHLAADLYIVLLDSIFSDPHATPSGREGYYYAENGEYSGYDSDKAVTLAAQELGLSKYTEPTSFTDEELQAEPKVTQTSSSA